ncbi:MAG: putative dehydrogenase [Capsulimonas sp.]|jgi:predicted dehydrogenase|nr:putative dehydrogenase [Capsulimonas sp.]
MSNPVGIAMIGVGRAAQRQHLPAYQKLQAEGKVKIVAVCDVDEETARAAAAEFGVPHAFTDWNEMLRMPEIDAVDVCTPNYLHKQPVVDAFTAGKHVLVEKPIAINAAEGAEMVAAAKAAGKQLQVGLNLRFGAAQQGIHRFIEDGKLGDIYYTRVHALRRRGIPSWGVFTQKDKQGGGPLIDIGVHMLDLALWFMGHPKPVSVSGATYAKFGHRSDILGLMGQWDPATFSVEDFAVGFVRFENGATLTLESSFAANLEQNEMNIHLFGTEGGGLLDIYNAKGNKIFREESGTLTDTTLAYLTDVMTHEMEIRSFVQAIADGTPVLATGEQGLMVTQILDALYQSAETGREIILASS